MRLRGLRQRCPKACTSFCEDAEGFCYPDVNITRYIDYGLCEKVCPVLNPREHIEPLNVCAALNSDEAVRRQISCGGIFTLLAEAVINRGAKCSSLGRPAKYRR